MITKNRRFAVLALLFALALAPAPAAASLYSRLCRGIKALRGSEMREIERRIADGMLSEGWREDGGATTLVSQAATLEPAEREKLLRALSSEKTKGELLHLALYDTAAWNRFIDRVASEGLEENHLFGSLQPVIDRMPVEMKDRLAARVGRLIESAEKKALDRVAPRRGLEAFVRVAYPADRIIDAAIRGGAKPSDALSIYLNTVRKRVFAGTSRASWRGEDIALVILTTMYTLRDHCKKVRAAGGKVSEPYSLILYGSFVNGFASKTSDIDLMTTGGDLKTLVDPINRNVAHLLAQRGLSPAPQIEPEHVFSALQQRVMASYSPIMFEVKENEVKMLVYPAKIESDERGQSTVTAPPLTYRFFPN